MLSKRYGVASGLVAIAVVGWFLPAQVSVAETASAGRSEAQRALAEAKKTGHRVEVVGERTERSTVYANPDGFSFRLEESAIPVRVAKPGGGWQAPDPTLIRRADGSVAPKAAAVQMSFSGGGKSDPLVRIADAGRSLSLRWPGRLPKPELDGTSAVYHAVLPDVDLKMTASSEGFRDVLVVKTPEAAANPRLKRLDFGLAANGLRVLTGTRGELSAVDATGGTVFRAPPAVMWDSAGRSALKAAKKSQPSLKDPTGSTGAVEEGVEPAPGDRVKKMGVKVAAHGLSVTPDANALAKTPESAFPLFIDPTVTWGESERTLLRSDGYEDYAWDNGSDGEGKGVGHCGTWNGYYCGPGYTQRLYFEYSPSALKGKKVLDATFRVTEPWAFQCDPRWVDLYRTNNISSSTTWSSRPTQLDLLVDRYVSAGRGSLCDPDEPAAPIEFNDNSDETNEDLTPTVENFAAGKFSRLTLEIRADDETDTSAWKRFKNDGVLAVDFVGLPDKPTSIGVVTGSGTVCETNESDPATITDPTPSLAATVQTKSGGESGAQLRAYFDIDEKSSDGTWIDTTAANGSLRPSTGFVEDGTKLTMSWSTLTDTKLYRYRAWTQSYYDNQTDYLSGPSNASTTGWCYFKVDSTAPQAPSIALSGGPYSECTPTRCVAAGGPGAEADFTVAAASGDTNVTAFEWKLSSTASWSAEVPGSSATLKVTPQHSGTYRLYVRAKDVTGRWGAENVFDFLVAAGAGPIAQWHFNEDSGAAVDSVTGDGVSSDATLNSGAARDDRGRRGVITHDASGVPLASPVTDKGLSLNGTGAYAATNGPVLETRSPYTVSAWVRLNNKDNHSMVLSQDGAHYSEFILAYEKDQDKWFFGVKQQDADDGTAYYGVSANEPTLVNTWTHLAATYDPQTGQACLYVNGKSQGTTQVPGSWSATGSFNIGRYLWADNRYYPFNGSIDEVSVWQRALTADEVREQASLKLSQSYNGAELVGSWDPASGSGTTVPDTASGYGRSLTLSSGASLSDGAMVLDGRTGAATTPGPVLDDTGSFTATAAVALDSATLLTKPAGYTGQVIGQRTATGSSWGFWFELTGTTTVLDDNGQEKTVPVGLWHFGRLGGGASESVASDEVAEMDAPVRLTGVFDAQAGTISLYLGHNQNGDDQVFTAQAGSGEFAAGKGFTGGAWDHYLPARITDVRLWAGAMASSDQISEAVGD